jgi:hypothetical protein
MTNETKDWIVSNGIFLRIALITALLLLIPLIAMQFTDEVVWGPLDFIVMGILLFSTASLFVILARKIPRSRRVIAGAGFAVVFLYVWAELAVGVFTNLGS